MDTEQKTLSLQHWPRVKQIFQAAIELEDAARAGYLAEACAGDEWLREEVASLLRAHEQSGSFMDSPAGLVAPHDESSATLTGQSLGHYQVLALLGRGGMGEVYRARDTVLGREAAVKILPAAFASDHSRLRRFEQEARAASALNHPNIVTVYEIGQAAVGTGTIRFIATEFVAGETLRWHIEQGGWPLAQTLEIAAQMASGLQAAHDAGIVHRDIKPENAMLRPDGLVKILDFGLAKLTEERRDDAATRGDGEEDDFVAASPRPRVAASVTAPGMVMGTARYMSPEQARGLAVDARTDIFSFGVVLFELLTGRAPFAGATTADVIAAILEREPPPLTSDVPVELQRIVNQALRKDRAARYQTSSELLLDLKNLREELSFAAKLESAGRRSGARQESAAADSASPNRSASRSLRRTGFALAALLIVMAGLGFALFSLLARKQSPPIRFQNPQLTRLTTTGQEALAAISPDGRYVAHVMNGAAGQSLWLRQTAVNSDKQIVEPSGLRYWWLAFARDGNYLYYTATEQGGADPILYQMPALGGAPRKLLTGARGQVAFSPDGSRFAFVRIEGGERKSDASFSEDRLVIANADGSGERVLTARKFPDLFYYARYADGLAWSPDGQLLAALAGTWAGNYHLKPMTLQAADGTQRIISEQRWHTIMGMAWLADGSGLLMPAAQQPGAARQIWHLAWPSGEVRRVTNDLSNYGGISLTADGRQLVTVQSERPASIWVMDQTDSASARQITHGSSRDDGSHGLTWTPDGKIVFAANTTGQYDLWITGADGSGKKQLTDDLYPDEFPSISPDNRRVVWTTARPDNVARVWQMDVDGGNARQLSGAGAVLWSDLSPDGRWVAYYSSAHHSLWRLPIEGGEATRLTDKLSVPTAPVISSNGKLIAYIFRDEEPQPRLGVAIISSEGGRILKMIELPPTTSFTASGLRWTPDGRALSYIDTRAGVSNLWLQPRDGSAPRQWTRFKELLIFYYAWSRDGRQLALSRGSTNSDVVLISDAR